MSAFEELIILLAEIIFTVVTVGLVSAIATTIIEWILEFLNIKTYKEWVFIIVFAGVMFLKGYA